jgi:hydroxyacylglutathione hydrolase
MGDIYVFDLKVCNCYLVRERGAVLIDTGPHNKTPQLLGMIAGIPFDPKDLSLIFITHGHWDHIGGLSRLKEDLRCPVAMNGREAESLERGGGPPVIGIGLWGKTFAGIVRMMASKTAASPVSVDVRMGDEDFSLEPYGISGTLVHTPGHSAGSTSLLLESGDAFIGDIAMNGFPLRLKPGLPIIAEDLEMVKKSYVKLLERGVKKIYPGHGEPFDAVVLERIVAA